MELRENFQGFLSTKIRGCDPRRQKRGIIAALLSVLKSKEVLKGTMLFISFQICVHISFQMNIQD